MGHTWGGFEKGYEMNSNFHDISTQFVYTIITDEHLLELSLKRDPWLRTDSWTKPVQIGKANHLYVLALTKKVQAIKLQFFAFTRLPHFYRLFLFQCNKINNRYLEIILKADYFKKCALLRDSKSPITSWQVIAWVEERNFIQLSWLLAYQFGLHVNFSTPVANREWFSWNMGVLFLGKMHPKIEIGLAFCCIC